MADKHIDAQREPARRDFGTREYENRKVDAYGAGRNSTGTYFAWFIGAAAVIGMLLFATGFFGSQTRDQANNPSLDKMQSTTAPSSQPSSKQPSTTGQGSQ